MTDDLETLLDRVDEAIDRADLVSQSLKKIKSASEKGAFVEAGEFALDAVDDTAELSLKLQNVLICIEWADAK